MSDGGDRIDLFPQNVLAQVASGRLEPASGDDAERNRRLYLGPVYAALTMPSDFDQQITAEAALSMVPAALLSSIARPTVDAGYALLDHIPEALRRPFEKAYGLLIDTGLAAASMATFPIVEQSVAEAARALPPSAAVDIDGYSQGDFACGETAAATVMKAAGEPVSLGDVDTQVAVGGGSVFEDVELRRRGLVAVGGFGNVTDLKTFIAAGYPVMVSVGWADGGGHYVVVSGYDDHRGTLTIKNWDDRGGTSSIRTSDFLADWARHHNSMTVVVPARDPRLDDLVRASTDLRRADTVYCGLTLSDFYITPDGKVFVEAAYRYVGASTDVTVRINWNQSQDELERQLGGTLAIRQRVAERCYIAIVVEKISLVGEADDWHRFSTTPLSIYASLETPGFQIKLGGEHGAFQASLAADLSKIVAGMGARVNGTVDEQGNYQVTGSIGWTF